MTTREILGLEQSITNSTAHEINRLWREIYQSWKEVNNSHCVSDKENNKAIVIFSKLLELIDRQANLHDHCFVLRKRAQHYSLTMKFEDALKDLYTERGYYCERHDFLRVKECDELISQISVWRNGAF